MVKYHQSPDGVLRVCMAEYGKCRYGNAIPHFDTKEEWQDFVQDEEEAKVNYTQLVELPTKDLLKAMGISMKAKGAEWETLKRLMRRNKELYASIDQKMYTPKSLHSKTKKAEISTFLKQVDENLTLKSVYMIAEDSDTFYVWTNYTDTGDVIAIDKPPLATRDKKTGYVQKVEVKDITHKAQLSKTTLEKLQEGDYRYKIPEGNYSTPEIRYFIDSYDPMYDSYRNRIVPLSQDESREYLLADYLSKGCKMLSLKTADGYIDVPLSKEDELSGFRRAKALLEENNVGVDLWIRANNSKDSRPLTEEDRKDFLEDYGEMFKDGKAKETFTVNDLKSVSALRGRVGYAYVRTEKQPLKTYVNNTQSKRRNAFIKLGNYVYVSDEDIPRDKVFSIDDFRLIPPSLMGEIYLMDENGRKIN